MENVILDGEWKAPRRGSKGLDAVLAKREGQLDGGEVELNMIN